MKISYGKPLSRGLAVVLTSALVLGASAISAPTSAHAEPLPETVSADALPTWQVNGVVWSQAIVGDVVYATGRFSQARPPGVAEGGPGSVPAGNIFAYNIRTGERVPFNHTLGGGAEEGNDGLVVRASADGKRLYVGGHFTTVDGRPRGHLAAFDLPSGKLSEDFKPNLDAMVRSITTTSSTVYVGGGFTSANGVSRSKLASFSKANGAITSWAPTADEDVWTMLTSPDQSRVIIGGSFIYLNGREVNGSGSLHATTGASLPWAVNTRVQASGNKGAITALATDGTKIYGAGYSWTQDESDRGIGHFEGTFAADPNTGQIAWVQDCLGDTYDVWPMNKVIYSVSHAHDCSNIGGFSDTTPRERWFKATASPDFATGDITHPNQYKWDFSGLKYPGLLHWYPDVAYGAKTDATQAAWSVVGNGEFLALGGEFPTVNGTPQEGLVRFTKRSSAPRKITPEDSRGLDPRAVVRPDGSVEVTFNTTYDMDDKSLTYELYRGWDTKIATFKLDSLPWAVKPIVHIDKGVAPGQKVKYWVKAVDSSGNFDESKWGNEVTPKKFTQSPYAARIAGLGARNYWRFEESKGSVNDSTGGSHGVPQYVSLGVPGALLNESSKSLSIAGNNNKNGRIVASEQVNSEKSLTIEAWVRPTTAEEKGETIRGGRIIGFGDQPDGNSYTFDRVLYLDGAGRPNLAIKDGEMRTLTAENGIVDGQWHHLVATADGAGMQLFVDGFRVARDQRYTPTSNYKGYWRIGAAETQGLKPEPRLRALIGQMDEVAVYPRALSLSEIQQNWVTSGRSSLSTRPTDAYGAAVSGDNPDLFWRLDSAAGQVADASGSGNPGTVWGGGLSLASGIRGGKALSSKGTDGVVTSQRKWDMPKEYSTELWFNTTTTKGGKLIGYGNELSGLSIKYDRHVYMLDSGQLSFGVYVTGQHSVVSAKPYNDGKWHHMVATQGSDGMKLWVDGELVGTNPMAAAGIRPGYWRIGGDQVWSGSSSTHFAGILDEVAVYPKSLSPDSIRRHYALGK